MATRCAERVILGECIECPARGAPIVQMRSIEIEKGTSVTPANGISHDGADVERSSARRSAVPRLREFFSLTKPRVSLIVFTAVITIVYLALLFAVLLVDHYLLIRL